jgi:hypothetical protein
MKHIDNNIAATRRRLMRRVWYSYAISLITGGVFVHGFLLGAVIALFGRLTHVSAIFHNLQAVPFAKLPVYTWRSIEGALTGGEVLTVLVTVLLVGLAVGAVARLAAVLGHSSSRVTA